MAASNKITAVYVEKTKEMKNRVRIIRKTEKIYNNIGLYSYQRIIRLVLKEQNNWV